MNPRRKRLLFWVVLFLLLYVFLEGASWAALKVLARFRHVVYAPVYSQISEAHREILSEFIAGETKYVGFSPALGWTLLPDGEGRTYRANAQGIRADRNYTPRPADGIFRIACFGDSFTHCDEVANADTWEHKLELMLSGSEVLNFGVGGYGADQAYLRYRRDGKRFQPHLVFIGFMSDDMLRHVNTFRPFYYPRTGLPLAKPGFRLEGGALVELPCPARGLSDYEELLEHPRKTLEAWSDHDAYARSGYRRGALDVLPSARLIKVALARKAGATRGGVLPDGSYDQNSEAYRVTLAILDAFCDEVLADGALPVVLCFPNRHDLLRAVGLGLDVDTKRGVRVYAPVLEHLQRLEIPCLDLLEAFGGVGAGGSGPGIEDCFLEHHYSPEGTARVAGHLREYLQRKGLTDPATTARQVGQIRSSRE